MTEHQQNLKEQLQEPPCDQGHLLWRKLPFSFATKSSTSIHQLVQPRKYYWIRSTVIDWNKTSHKDTLIRRCSLSQNIHIILHKVSLILTSMCFLICSSNLALHGLNLKNPHPINWKWLDELIKIYQSQALKSLIPTWIVWHKHRSVCQMHQRVTTWSTVFYKNGWLQSWLPVYENWLSF